MLKKKKNNKFTKNKPGYFTRFILIVTNYDSDFFLISDNYLTILIISTCGETEIPIGLQSLSYFF